MSGLTPESAPSPWVPEPDAGRLKVLGKLGEEASELGKAACRAIIQGLDEAEPVTGKPNRQALEEEIGDVLANVGLAIERLGLDEAAITARAERKLGYLSAWLEMLPAPGGVMLPADLTREQWAAAGDAVVRLQQAGVGHHDKIIEAVWRALLEAAPQPPQPLQEA